MSFPSSPSRQAPPVLSFVNAAADEGLIEISASSEVPSMPVANLRSFRLDRPWQSLDGSTTATISWHYFGIQSRYGIFGVDRYVAPWETKIRLELWSGSFAGSGDLVYSSGDLFAWSPYLPPREVPIWGTPGAWPRRSNQQLSAMRARFLHCPWGDTGEKVSPVPHRSGRLTFAFDGAPPSSWSAACLWIGDAWQPSDGFRKFEPSLAAVGGSAEEGPGGRYVATNRVFQGEHRLTFQGPEWEMDDLAIGCRLAGDAAPFLVWPRPWDGTQAFAEAGLYRPYGPIAKTDIEAWDSYGQRIWSLALTLKEWL